MIIKRTQNGFVRHLKCVVSYAFQNTNLSTALGLNTEESKLKERNTMEFDFV